MTGVHYVTNSTNAGNSALSQMGTATQGLLLGLGPGSPLRGGQTTLA